MYSLGRLVIAQTETDPARLRVGKDWPPFVALIQSVRDTRFDTRCQHR